LSAWHAVRTRPDAEGRASIGIAGSGREAYLPIELVRKDFRRGREIGWQPLFRGYVFARCDLERDLPRLLEIEGVADVLKSPPIADDIIETIRRHEQLGVFDRTRQARFTAGDTVRLTGPLAGLVAKIRSARPRRRAALILELVGLPFRVVAPAGKLEKIA
jgi:transcription antitermination factor NusG